STAPLLEAVEYRDMNFSNRFAQQSKYRGPPTPDIEEAWQELLKLNPVSIPEDKIELLGRSPRWNWQRFQMSENGPSEGSYVAGIEVFHQLHCLNLVRQFTWLDHYTTPPQGLTGSAVETRMHVDHCLETLRIILMCNADVTPFLMEQDQSFAVGGRADFNAYHRCKDWGKIVEWMDENSFSSSTSHSSHGQ
ncbi:oxidase ustYa family protein, partial [Aspergillus ibericus CBS 121593]